MFGRSTRTARIVAILTVLAVASLAEPSAHAFPVLRLFVQGNAQQVASGGSGVFMDLDAEARRLERPAGLTLLSRGELAIGMESQSIVQVRRGEFEGTLADDHQTGLRMVAPLHLGDRTVTLGASFRHQVAAASLFDAENGLHLSLTEGRAVGNFGMAGTVSSWLALGISAEVAADTGLGVMTEARIAPSEWLALSLREGVQRTRYLITAPSLLPRQLTLPALTYDLNHAQRVSEALLEIGSLEHGMLRALFDVSAPHRAYAELVTPALPLVFRGALERTAIRFDDFVTAAGAATLARAQLDVTRYRAIAGADLQTTAGSFTARVVKSAISSRMGLRELGTAASQALTDVDLELDLYARTNYDLETTQVIAGWTQTPGTRFQFSGGLQLLQLAMGGDVAFGATSLAMNQTASLNTSSMSLLAATVGVKVKLSEGFYARYSFAQFVPLSLHSDKPSPWLPEVPEPADEEGPPHGLPPLPAPTQDELPMNPFRDARGPSGSVLGEARRQLKGYGGGNLQVFEIVHEF